MWRKFEGSGNLTVVVRDQDRFRLAAAVVGKSVDATKYREVCKGGGGEDRSLVVGQPLGLFQAGPSLHLMGCVAHVTRGSPNGIILGTRLDDWRFNEAQGLMGLDDRFRWNANRYFQSIMIVT
ncbi:hypothetical protein CDAR_456471 [Caerostris darwini]|uniref:Uncharacterized protein n=1 Tax=Caerostris darwini TaxID=1538125 RepID=A0AAV4NYS3_9ARAC|nr:hypothetical protein CDAR_456471 [Caerostris darwini]